MSALLAGERRGDAHLTADDVPGWVVAAFLLLVLFALAAAYLTGQADRCQRLAADGVAPRSCQAQGGAW